MTVAGVFSDRSVTGTIDETKKKNMKPEKI